MKKASFFLLFLWISSALPAQYKVTFIINKFPTYHQSSNSVYVAGNFNGWNPKDAKLRLSNSGITIELKKGMYEYKYTRGSWDAVESGDGGFPVQNHIINVTSDTIIQTEIDHWADHFPKKAKETTASVHVKILDTAFYIPQLNRHRRVWIYLPQSYSTSRKKYPVIYMQDGQNLFDNATAPYGEWGVDEALDTLSKEHGETIVVAIDHGAEKRINEYSPFDIKDHGKGEGDAYVDFLAQTLLPYINKNFRTKKAAKYTGIAGSSMGGLISFYAMLKYPNMFGTAGVFSPAFWIVPQLKELAIKRACKLKGRIYFYAGGAEGETMVPDMLSVFEAVNKCSKAKMETVVRAEGRHTEQTWREEFPLFYQWMMKESKH